MFNHANVKKMKKVTKMVLMLCLTLSGALCYAKGAAGTENEKGNGIPIELIEAATLGGPDKSGSVLPSIDGHNLTVFFSENLGQVVVEITYASGATIENLWIVTPNGIQTYLPLAGDYVITFTLPNGDEYYGEFTVTD